MCYILSTRLDFNPLEILTAFESCMAPTNVYYIELNFHNLALFLFMEAINQYHDFFKIVLRVFKEIQFSFHSFLSNIYLLIQLFWNKIKTLM